VLLLLLLLLASGCTHAAAQLHPALVKTRPLLGSTVIRPLCCCCCSVLRSAASKIWHTCCGWLLQMLMSCAATASAGAWNRTYQQCIEQGCINVNSSIGEAKLLFQMCWQAQQQSMLIAMRAGLYAGVC
jgi:hypothetical protein